MSKKDKLNVELLTKIAEWLEGGAVHVDQMGNKYAFDMNAWHCPVDSTVESVPADYPDCGTVMCIGGAVMQFLNEDDVSLFSNYQKIMEERAGKALGMESKDSYNLFYPWHSETFNHAKFSDYDLTPANCAKVIRNLIATGEVDWGVIVSVESPVTHYEDL